MKASLSRDRSTCAALRLEEQQEIGFVWPNRRGTHRQADPEIADESQFRFRDLSTRVIAEGRQPGLLFFFPLLLS
jgi:hypothetical protein